MIRFDGKSYSDQYVKTAIRAAEEAAMPEADPVESSNTPLYLACETPRGVLLRTLSMRRMNTPELQLIWTKRKRGIRLGW